MEDGTPLTGTRTRRRPHAPRPLATLAATPAGGLSPAPVPAASRICLFRALPGLGDLLCAVPAMRAIRRARPEAVITLVAHPAAVPLAGRFRDYLDEVVPFPGFPGLPDRRPDVAALPGFLAAMHARRFDLAVQLHGRGDRTNDVVRLLGARRTAGFHPRGAAAPEATRYLPWREDEPEVLRWLRLVGHLGFPSDDPHLELPLDPAADAMLDAILAEAGVDGRRAGRLAVVHPGASTADRRWQPKEFAEVADRLVDDGLTVVLTGGPGDRPVTELVRSLSRRPAALVDLAGRTSLDALGALLVRAEILVANDTGVSHVATAVGTPSVVVFTGSAAARWAPLDATRHRAVLGGSIRRVADEARRVVARGRAATSRRPPRLGDSSSARLRPAQRGGADAA